MNNYYVTIEVHQTHRFVITAKDADKARKAVIELSKTETPHESWVDPSVYEADPEDKPEFIVVELNDKQVAVNLDTQEGVYLDD